MSGAEPGPATSTSSAPASALQKRPHQEHATDAAAPDSLDAGITAPVLASALAAALSSLNLGWCLGEPNIPESIVKDCVEGPKILVNGLPTCLPMSSTMWGLVVGMVAVGALAGSLTAGLAADRFGRKTVLLANNVFFIAGALLLSTSTTIAQLTLGRFVSGIGCGVASAAVATYNSECAPVKVRGLVGTMLHLSIEVGIFVSQLASALLADVPDWRILFGLGAAASLVQLLWLPFMPESPRFLASHGRVDEAARALRFLRPRHDISLELAALTGALQPADEAGFVPDTGDEAKASEAKICEDNGASSGAASQHAVPASQASSGRSKAIGLVGILRGRTPDVLWHPLFCTLFLMGFQQWSGTKGVVFYSTEIMEKVFHMTRAQVRRTPNSAQWVTIGIAATGIVGVLAGACLIDRLGRRRLLQISTGGLSIACVLVTVGRVCNAPVLAAASLFAFKIVYCLGLGPIPWLCASEMLPYYALGTVSGVACALNWTAVFTIGMLFPALSRALDNYLFLPFAALNAVAFATVLLFVPETKGRLVGDVLMRHGRGLHVVLSMRKARPSTSDEAHAPSPV